MQVVRVIWHDAHSECESWIEIDGIDPEPRPIDSVGFLIPDAKEGHVTIAQSHDAETHIDSVLSIPVAMVQSMQVLC
jgi:hypothetical protein